MSIADSNFHTVVIGGGMAGLVSAGHLADKGKKVLLIEKGNKLGGRASTTHIHQSCLNLGPHALYKRGEGCRILAELGIIPKGNEPRLSGLFFTDRKAHSFPSSPLALLKSSYLSWKEKLEFIKLYTSILKGEWTQIPEVTFAEWLQEKRVSDKVAVILQTLVTISSYCGDMHQISAPFAIRQIQLAKEGVLYISGGWETIVDSLEHYARGKGVEIVKGEKVKNIEGSYPAFRVELESGEKVGCQTIISSTSPQQLPKLLGEDSKLTILTQLTPLQGAAFDLIVEMDETDQTSFGFDVDRLIYYSNHSKAAMLSDKYEVIHLFGYGTNYSKQDMEDFLDKIQPNWRRRKVYSRFLPNMVVSNGLPNRKTAEIAGQASSIIKGLFPVGDWCLASGLLADASLSSGKKAAMEVEQLLKGGEISADRRVV